MCLNEGISVIDAPAGKIEGVRNQYGMRYLGIPFAKPPIEDLAFRDPQPADRWNDVLQAAKPGHNPLQPKGTWSLGDNSQDCLYLNVFVPDHAENEILPVMVWIYGGSWMTGGAGWRQDVDDLEYDPGLFARDSHTIVVTFNYRLNAYGFLNLHFLSDRFDENIGLKDQILALHWVHDNIAAFSGDPENVTLFGQSAGAASILALLCIEEAKPLFCKSVLQSSNTDHFHTEKESEENARRLLRLLQISEKKPEKILTADEKKVLDGCHKASHMLYPRGDIRCFFSPVIDEKLLKGNPKELFDTGKPMLTGTMKDEADIIIAETPKILLPFFSKILPIHVEKGRTPYSKRVSNALTEWIYRNPMKQVLSRMQDNAWAYEYDLVLPIMASHGLGAFHASEIPVLFGWDAPEVFEGIEEKAAETGKQMRKIWGEFARTGKCSWEPYRKRQKVLHIGR